MATAGRNLLDGKKRQASLLGSTLTSLTLNSENDSTTSSEEDSVTESESSCEDEIKTDGDTDQNSEEENALKSNTNSNNGNVSSAVPSNAAKAKKEQSRKDKPKVRMKTLTIDGQLVYFCVICDKIFTKKKDKINHELAHNNETLISCPECGKDFFHESSLAHHIRSHDGEQLHFCDFCPKMFAQSHQLKAHVLSHSKSNEITCKICCVEFKTTSELNVHHRNNVKEEMSTMWCNMCNLYCCRIHCDGRNFNRLHAFRCSACNELFYTLKKLKLHAKRYAHKFDQPDKIVKAIMSDTERESMRVQPFIVSGKRQTENNRRDDGPMSKKSRTSSLVNNEDPLVMEQSIESEVEPDGISKLKEDLEYSRKFCKSQRKPYCKKCNRSFKESSDLISHKLSAHSSSHGSMCRDCGEDFNSSADLKKHVCKIKLLRPHSPSGLGYKSVRDTDNADSRQLEVFECHICAKTFLSHDQLQNHLRLHTNIKSFQCYLCQRNFVTKHYLQRHLQVHIQDGSIGKTGNKRIENASILHSAQKGDILSDDDFTNDKMNHNPDVTSSLKSGLDKENICSFSDDSASSFLAKESDKSDAYQLSSASSHSFKVSMARERRKLRKRRSFSKALFCKRMLKKRMLNENIASSVKSIVYVDKLPEEENDVNNFVVEINGARSEVDQETTIFVELTLATLVSKKTSVLRSLDGIDKENKIPPCCLSGNVYNADYHNSRLFDKMNLRNSEKKANHFLTNKVMVLDLEVEDFGAESFSSIFGELSANPKKLKSPELVPSSMSSSNRNYGSVMSNQSFKSEYHSQMETTSLQPLHSLHLMTAKFTEGKGKSSIVPFSKTCISEHDRTTERMSHTHQDGKFAWSTSGKTCRDIAASWKSNRALMSHSKDPALVNESLDKLNLNRSKESGSRPERVGALKNASAKPLYEYERTDFTITTESISTNVKSEYPTSCLPLSTVNLSAFRSCVESSQHLPSSFCEVSRGSSLLPTPHSSSHIKREFIDVQEKHGQSLCHHPCRSSSSVIISNSLNLSNDDKLSSFSTSCTQSAPCSSQQNKVFHFDTDNPALRDMNLMEMVCSIQTHTPSTVTVAQHENHCQAICSSSNIMQDIKRETDCQSQSFTRNIKTELTYLSPYADNQHVLSNSINPPRGLGFQNSLPSPSMNFNPNANTVNPSLIHFHPPNVSHPSNPNPFRSPFQQSNWPLQMQASLPPQGPHFMNNSFPLLQIPTGNNDLNLNRFTYNNADNLILNNPGQFGLPNPLAQGITNHISDLPPLRFGHPTPALFHANVAPLPAPLPHLPVPPAMLPSNGVFYLPF